MRVSALLEIVDHRANFGWTEQFVTAREQLLVGVGRDDRARIDAQETFGHRMVALRGLDP